MISAPACYGKLPALGDYLQHRATGAETGLWWNRFSSMQEPASPRHHDTLPWCFVLAPDVFSWAAGVHVLGVLMASRDRIGRHYPFVVWQKAKVQGLQQACLFGQGQGHVQSTAHPETQQPLQAGEDNPRNWLFWLSRLVQAHVLPVGHEPRNDFPADMDRLWALFRPTWTARFGVAGKLPPEERCREIVGPCATLADVEGVRFMPWAHWPQTLWAPGALCWFWQQDHEGRYLRALRDHNVVKRVLWAMLC